MQMSEGGKCVLLAHILAYNHSFAVVRHSPFLHFPPSNFLPNLVLHFPTIVLSRSSFSSPPFSINEVLYQVSKYIRIAAIVHTSSLVLVVTFKLYLSFNHF